MAELFLIRGLPGSGKTTLALKLARTHSHVEADMYHTRSDGCYIYNPANAVIAHKWCLLTADRWLSLGKSVVVANTFVTNSSMQPYFELAARHHVTIRVIEARGDYGTIHPMPQEVIDNMRARWEPLTPELAAIAVS